MPRTPKPWYWKARAAWYVQVNGKHVRLAEDKRQADREFYRLMAADGKLDSKQRVRITVDDACEARIEQAQVYRASTRRHYTEKYQAFADAFRGRLLATVTCQEVTRWITGYKGAEGPRPYGDASRHLQFKYVKSLFQWARDSGLLEHNEFARAVNPWRVTPRDRPMSPEEYEAVMLRKGVSKEFLEVVELIWRTGIRPGEVATLSAKHLDARLPVARLQPTEHKTGRRTGLQREIFFPPDLWEKMQAYAQQHKTGPIIRRRNGKPWVATAISVYFSRLKRAMGLECVLYQARHRFFTALIEDGGVPAARAAKIGGHNDPHTLMKHYYHPDTIQMAADVAAGSDKEQARMDDIASKIAEQRVVAKAKKAADGAAAYRRKKEAKKPGTSDV